MIFIKNIKLTPPCSYQGGKQRLAKKIVDIIYEETNIDENTKFYDLCCGSGAISLEMINRGFNPNNIVMVDKGVYGSFWLEVANDEVELEKLKKLVDNIPSKEECKKHLENMSKEFNKDNFVYQYLLLQSGSFGGKEIYLENNKWKHHGFRDYWLPTATSVRRSPCNPMQPNHNELYKRVEDINTYLSGTIRVINDSIERFLEYEDIKENSIIYIDPPYQNTTGYSNNLDIKEIIHKIKNTPLFVSECQTLSDNYRFVTKGKSKGNITGVVKNKRKDDILNIFNL